jgi:uncharacterized membrane protein YgcG
MSKLILMHRKNIRPLAAAFVFILAAVMIISSAVSVFADGTADYTTDAFDVTAVASENHVFHVTEKITVDFTTEHHGITRYIPVQSKYYTIKNIKTPGFNNDISLESGTYSVGRNYNYKLVRIGDADQYLTGRQTFVLSYDMVCYRDDSKSADYLSLDLLPTGWETGINKASLTLTMPKMINWSNVSYYAGGFGTSEALSSYFTKSVSGNKLTITGKNIPANYGVTVNSNLSEGYWVDPANHDFAKYILYIVLIGIPLLVFLLWLFFGRDPKIVKTVEFYPPEGMTPAEIGYIIDGKVDNKDMASMLMYFAEKGYVKIKETSRDTFEITRLKDMDESEKVFAKTMFDAMFVNGETVQMDDMPETFGISTIAARDELKGYYDEPENKLFKTSASVCRVIGDVLMFVPAVVGVILAAFETFNYSAIFMLIPVAILLIIGMVTVIVAYDRHSARSRAKNVTIFILGLIPAIAGTAVAAVTCGILANSWILALGVFVSMAVTYVFVVLMKARTEKGAKWQGQILGFRDFIRTAEYDRLKLLSDKDPEYFYNVMPYAYVMGMSTKWAKKFENISVRQPGWYSTYSAGDFIFTALWYDSMMRSCTRGFTGSISEATAIDIGGDVGDFGGGFGGGGFSGGGFGGGGGGAW